MKSLTKTLKLATTSLLVGLPLSSFAAIQLSDSAEIFFTGTAAFEYEDNIFRNATEVDDISFIFTPGVELLFNDDAAISLNLSYNHEFKYYDDNSGLDENYAHAKFGATYDTGIFVGKVNASYDELSANTLDVNNVADRFDRDQTKVSVSGKYDISDLTAIQLGVNIDETDYETPTFFDVYSTSIPVTVFYQIRPKVDLTAGYRYREVDVDNAGDYSDQYFFVGAVGELFSPKIRADLNFGIQDRDADVVGADFSTSTYNARVVYLADASSSYFLSLSRDFNSAAASGTSIIQTLATVGGNYSFSRELSGMVSLSVGESDYDNSLREEDIVIFTLGGSYSPNDYLKLNVRYQYQDIDGDTAVLASDYTNNKLIISATVRY